jgi:hypothetical protein
MTVASQGDVGFGPMATDAPHKPADMGSDLGARWRLAHS